MKLGQFLNDLQQSLPFSQRRSLAGRLVFVAGLLLGILAFSAFAFYLFPRIQNFARWGYVGLFLGMFLSSSSVLLPVPGLALELTAAAIWNPLIVALVASVAVALGEITGYLVGYGGRNLLAPQLSGKYAVVDRWLQRYGGFTVFFISFIPIFLFDLVGLVAGAAKFPWWKFLLYTWAGRLCRSLVLDTAGAGLFRLILPYLPQ